jgi:hypothetical protein
MALRLGRHSFYHFHYCINKPLLHRIIPYSKYQLRLLMHSDIVRHKNYYQSEVLQLHYNEECQPLYCQLILNYSYNNLLLLLTKLQLNEPMHLCIHLYQYNHQYILTLFSSSNPMRQQDHIIAIDNHDILYRNLCFS